MKHLLLLPLVILTCLATLAQKVNDKEAWRASFNGEINFYKLTEAGIMVVGTDDALYGLNPETGAVAWKHDFLKKIKEENFDPIDGSPMVAIIDRGLNPEHVIVNVVDGQVVCKSKEIGLNAVTKRFPNAVVGGIMFYGINKKGKPTMMLVDAATGTKRWEAEKIFDKNTEVICSNLYAQDEKGFLIATTKAVYKVNAATGEEMWRSEIKSDPPAPAAVKGGFGFGKMNAAQSENATSISAKFFQVKDPSKIYFYNNDVFTCFNWADGKEVWKRQELKSPVNNYIIDDRGIIVTTNENDENEGQKKGGGLMGKMVRAATDASKARLYMFDYNDGHQLTADPIKISGNVVGYSYDNTRNKMVVATANEKGKNRITVIDLTSGKEAIKNPLKVDGNIMDIKLVSKGLLYITSDEMNILDLETGKDAWSKSLKVKKYIVHGFKGDDLYIASDGSMYHLNTKTSEYNKINKAAMDFSGGEVPKRIEFKEDKILVCSDQNVHCYDMNGNQSWNIYRKAPGISLAGKIALGALAVTSTAMMAANSYAAGSARACVGCTYQGMAGGSVSNYDAANFYEGQAKDWGRIATSSFKEMNKRFNATKNTDNYISILTYSADNDESGVGVELYNKNSGTKDAVVIMRDKKPDYFVDDISRIVYWKKDNKTMTAIRF